MCGRVRKKCAAAVGGPGNSKPRLSPETVAFPLQAGEGWEKDEGRGDKGKDFGR